MEAEVAIDMNDVRCFDFVDECREASWNDRLADFPGSVVFGEVGEYNGKSTSGSSLEDPFPDGRPSFVPSPFRSSLWSAQNSVKILNSVGTGELTSGSSDDSVDSRSSHETPLTTLSSRMVMRRKTVR